jgi:hypothetical protein
METRAKNKTTHPGEIQKSSKPRRSKEEVQQEKDAKAETRKALADARQQSINRTADFEHADIANEAMVDATPRPLFTPKKRCFSQNHKNSPLTSFANSSDIEVLDRPAEAPFIPGSDASVDVGADDPADAPTPRAPPAGKKKAKINKKHKATAASMDAKNLGETASRKRPVEDSNVSQDSDEEEPRKPKPKKVKTKMRDEINDATMKIFENEKEGNRYATMIDSMGSGGKTVSTATVPSNSPAFQAADGRQLKREGAIADIKNLKKKSGKKLKKERAFADITRPDADNNNLNR